MQIGLHYFPFLSTSAKEDLFNVIKRGTFKDLVLQFGELQYTSLSDEQDEWDDTRKTLVNNILIPTIKKHYSTPSTVYSSLENYKEEQWRHVSPRVFTQLGYTSIQFMYEQNKWFVSNYGRLVYFTDLNTKQPVPNLSSVRPNIDDEYIRNGFDNTITPPAGGGVGGGTIPPADEGSGLDGSEGNGNGGTNSYIKRVRDIPRSYVVFFTFYNYVEFDKDTMMIDHINEDRSDNHFINLWPLSNDVNKMVRTKLNRNNRSNANGVSVWSVQYEGDELITEYAIGMPTPVDAGQTGQRSRSNNMKIYKESDGKPGAIRERFRLKVAAGHFGELSLNHILFLFYKRDDLLEIYEKDWNKVFLIDYRTDDDNDDDDYHDDDDTINFDTESEKGELVIGAAGTSMAVAASRQDQELAATLSTTGNTTASQYNTPHASHNRRHQRPQDDVSGFHLLEFPIITGDRDILVGEEGLGRRPSHLHIPRRSPRRHPQSEKIDTQAAPHQQSRNDILVGEEGSVRTRPLHIPRRSPGRRQAAPSHQQSHNEDYGSGPDEEEEPSSLEPHQRTLRDLLTLKQSQYDIEQDGKGSLYDVLLYQLKKKGILDDQFSAGILMMNIANAARDFDTHKGVTNEKNTLNEFVGKLKDYTGAIYSVEKFRSELLGHVTVDDVVKNKVSCLLVSFLYNVTVVCWTNGENGIINQYERWDTPRKGNEIFHILASSNEYFPLAIESPSSENNNTTNNNGDQYPLPVAFDNEGTPQFFQLFQGQIPDNDIIADLPFRINGRRLQSCDDIPDTCEVKKNANVTVSGTANSIMLGEGNVYMVVATANPDGKYFKHAVVFKTSIDFDPRSSNSNYLMPGE